MLDVFKETGRTVCASVDQKVGKVARERDIVGRGMGMWSAGLPKLNNNER